MFVQVMFQNCLHSSMTYQESHNYSTCLNSIDSCITHTHTYGYGSIPIDTFLMGWTSIYQLFCGSLGVPGFWLIAILISNQHADDQQWTVLTSPFNTFQPCVQWPTCQEALLRGNATKELEAVQQVAAEARHLLETTPDLGKCVGDKAKNVSSNYSIFI